MSGEAGMFMTEMLLKMKADPNLSTHRRKTALKIACAAQDVPMVNLLLNHKVISMFMFAV
jgi:ankyrin repeat protein